MGFKLCHCTLVSWDCSPMRMRTKGCVTFSLPVRPSACQHSGRAPHTLIMLECHPTGRLGQPRYQAREACRINALTKGLNSIP